MKYKNIIKATSFLAILLALLVILSFLFTLQHSTEGILSEPAHSLDYVAMGDSECMTTISPMDLWNQYGYAGYNCGVSSQRLQTIYYDLNKILKKQNPKALLLETNSFYKNSSYLQEGGNMFDGLVDNILPVFGYHNDWKNIFILHKSNKTKMKELSKGFRYDTRVNPYIGGPYAAKTKKVKKMDPLQLIYLNKIVELCKQRNIQLIFYTSPSPVNWTYPKHNGIAHYAKEHQIPFIDLNLKTDALKINWSNDTFDQGDHLNFYGAQKATNYMGKYLSQNCQLTDHRNDKRYDTWNKNLPEYLQKTQQST